MKIIIQDKDHYSGLVSKGLNPLLDWEFFTTPIYLRVALQNELFGKYELSRDNIPIANQKFYRWVWENKPHNCEETGQSIYQYSSVHVSHILTREAHPEMSLDPRNINILIKTKHDQWETGKRVTMRIYWINQHVINILKKEYGSL